MNPDDIYNFDFVKFFEKKNLDDETESTKTLMTSSTCPKRADCFQEDEKWLKIMKFLRANPNLLLKVVPTTSMIDEQGVQSKLFTINFWHFR